MLFQCSRCQRNLKKNKVAQHVFKCSSDGHGGEEEHEDDASPVRLSCVDCGVQLTGNDYLTHSNCKATPVVSSVDDERAKHEQMRNVWGQKLRKAIVSSSLIPSMKEQLETVKLELSPRKLTKFQNYVRNLPATRDNQVADSDVLFIFTAARRDFKEQFNVKTLTDKHPKLAFAKKQAVEQSDRKKRAKKRRRGVIAVVPDIPDDGSKRTKLAAESDAVIVSC